MGKFLKKDFKSIFERAFGKAPKKGYIIKDVTVSIGWRAIVLSWLAKGIGFGEIALFFEDKKIKIDTENMPKKFCDEVVKKAIQKLKKEEIPRIKENRKVIIRNIVNSDFLKNMYKNVTWGNK